MSSIYRVSTEDCCEGYEVLLRPDGSELCCLTEPEDRNFSRDLKDVVSELNRLKDAGRTDKGVDPIARKGEQQYAVICRQRSGQDAGVITPVARVFEIEKLCNGDQQDCVSAALILAEMVISKCKPSNRIGCDHLLERVNKLITP